MRYVFYHADCMDGLAAGLAACLYFDFLKTEMKPLQFGWDVDLPDDTEAVWFLDVIPSNINDLYLDLPQGRIHIIDHHKSTKYLADYSRKYGGTFIHDKNHSACVLAWNHFFEAITLPLFYEYIEDRDLWKWEMEDSRAVNAFLRSFPMRFPSLLNHIQMEKEPGYFKSAIDQGRGIVRHIDQQVKIMVDSGVVQLLDSPVGPVPVMNRTCYRSEVGEYLIKAFSAPLSITFRHKTDGFTCSFRSAGTVDVERLARTFSGGGHSNSSGCFIKQLNVNDLLMDLSIALMGIPQP